MHEVQRFLSNQKELCQKIRRQNSLWSLAWTDAREVSKIYETSRSREKTGDKVDEKHENTVERTGLG